MKKIARIGSLLVFLLCLFVLEGREVGQVTLGHAPRGSQWCRRVEQLPLGVKVQHYSVRRRDCMYNTWEHIRSYNTMDCEWDMTLLYLVCNIPSIYCSSLYTKYCNTYLAYCCTYCCT